VLHLTPDQLTAAALPGEPTEPDVTAHLTRCATCAAEVDALRRTVGHAREGMTLDAPPPPPPQIWDGILDRLGDDAPSPVPPSPLRSPSPTGRPRRLLGAGVAAVAALAAVAAIAIAVLTGSAGSPESPAAPARVALVALRPGVAGEVVSTPGPAMHLDLTLPGPVPAGDGLEVWDMSSASPRSLGTLHPAGSTHWTGDLALPGTGPGMPPLDVSLESPDADPGHSGISLARTP
jgi:hypothetical protein